MRRKREVFSEEDARYTRLTMADLVLLKDIIMSVPANPENVKLINKINLIITAKVAEGYFVPE